VVNQDGDPSFGFISSGVPYQYVREAFPDAPVLKLTMTHPLPQEKIKEFAGRVKRLYVVEELDPFLEMAIRAMGVEVIGKEAFPILGELSTELVHKGVTGKERKPLISVPKDLPARPPTLCTGCPHRGVFTVLRKLNVTVMGDIGCYTLAGLPPLSALHSCVCMGAGIGMAHGATMAGAPADKTAAIIGDSTFMHSGITGVMDIVYNKGVATVIVLDNATTAMTGKQDHPGTGVTLKGEKTKKVSIEAICRAVGVERVRYVDPYNLEETERVLKEELGTKEPSVIITTRPCTLITKERPNVTYAVDEERCIGCGKCSKVACVAVFMSGNGERVATIDPLLCYGCGVCAQVCPKNAIVTINGNNREN
jgi:indolepyruvate ferredoxin oxidoreductase alpha subunit